MSHLLGLQPAYGGDYVRFVLQPDCFKIKNPSFTVSLSPALNDYVGIWRIVYLYLVGINDHPQHNRVEPIRGGLFLLCVKLPCNTGSGKRLPATIHAKGNQLRCAQQHHQGSAGGIVYHTGGCRPQRPASRSSSTATAGYFITTSPTTAMPLEFNVATNFLPAVHLKNSPNSVLQKHLAGGVELHDQIL